MLKNILIFLVFAAMVGGIFYGLYISLQTNKNNEKLFSLFKNYISLIKEKDFDKAYQYRSHFFQAKISKQDFVKHVNEFESQFGLVEDVDKNQLITNKMFEEGQTIYRLKGLKLIKSNQEIEYLVVDFSLDNEEFKITNIYVRNVNTNRLTPIGL